MIEKNRLYVPMLFLLIVSIIFSILGYLKSEYDNSPTLSVLMFHMVTEDMPDEKELETLYVTDEVFRKYVEYFSKSYNIVSLDEACDIIKNKKKVDNPNLMAITFDDGYQNNYILAYPILKELGVKANINVIARYTDEGYPGYLTWQQVKEMTDSGVITIGSHTYDSHYYTNDNKGKSRPVLASTLLNESNEERKERIFYDLSLADDMISNNIGKEINIIAYPYGVPPFDLMEDISRDFGYNIQIMVRPGVNSDEGMFSELKRFTVNGNEMPEELDKTINKYKGIDFLGA